MEIGSAVEVFCRFCPWSAKDKFAVAQSIVGATQFPRSAKTDGWVQATVVEFADSDPRQLLKVEQGVSNSWVRIQFKDRLWVDSTGNLLKESSLFQWMPVSEVRHSVCPTPTAPQSILMVRWGGPQPVDHLRFDFAVSDNLIQDMSDALHARWGKELCIHTVWVSGSADLGRISQHTAVANGVRMAFYFLWGSNHDLKPGYVLSGELVNLMERMESVGIVTKYPNHASLYRLLTSKEYQPLLSTNPLLGIPPSVLVPASKLLANPDSTCAQALRALGTNLCSAEVVAGVVKVGNEWMGEGVRAFAGDLRAKAQSLLDGGHGVVKNLIVQKRIPNLVCEPRVFVLNGSVRNVRYTWNEKVDKVTGRIHALRTCPQSRAATERFGGDAGAQRFVEGKIRILVENWNKWLLAVTGEVPVFVRMDFLVEAIDSTTFTESSDHALDGWVVQDEPDTPLYAEILPPLSPEDEARYENKYKVWTCELGEIGSSMVGFREGKDLLFSEIANSCGPVEQLPILPKKPTRPPPTLD